MKITLEEDQVRDAVVAYAKTLLAPEYNWTADEHEDVYFEAAGEPLDGPFEVSVYFYTRAVAEDE